MITKAPALLPLALLLIFGGLATGVGSCVVVQPGTVRLQVGETAQLEARGNRDEAFEWRTTNPNVVTVSDTGVVTGVARGTAYVTATGATTGGVGRAFIRVVGDGPAVLVTLSPGAGQVDVGETFDFDATSTDPEDTSFEWSSGNESIATVDQNGTVTGVAPGVTTITATGSNSGVSGSANLTVNEVAAAEVTITAPATSVQVGNTLQLTAASTDPADTSFTWESSNTDVATVSGTGLVTGVAVGTANISATGSSSGALDSVAIQVTDPGTGNQAPTANAGADITAPFNTTLTLDGTASSDPENDPLTYAWTQVSGPTVTLSDPTAARPSFTPPQAGTYVFQLIVNDGQNPSAPDTVTVTAENVAPDANIVIEGISEFDVAARGLVTGESSGLNTVGAGTDVYLRAVARDPNNEPIAAYQWAVTAQPSGANPTFTTTTEQETVFTPDVVGTYEVTLTVADAGNAQQTVAQPIHAALWVGAGVVTPGAPGQDATIAASGCTGCHSGTVARDAFTPWLGTAHATAFARFVDGLTDLEGFCTDDVLRVLTVGFNPDVNNGGFDDVAAAAGFAMPQTQAPGTYASLVQQFPNLMKLANVQCENCHGPASLHPANAFSEDPRLTSSLDSGVCGQCHTQELEWSISGHGDADSQAFTYPIGPTRAACVKCHSGQGYIDFAEGRTPLRTGYQTHTCAVCHDPHGTGDTPAQLRIYGSAVLPGDLVIENVGAAATCMTCHNGRRGPADALNSGFPHYSTAAENLKGVNAVDYNGAYTFPNSVHALATDCTTCHMAPTPNGPCDQDVVGGHTFAVVSNNGTPEDPSDDVHNLANACGACHGNITTVNLTADGDYDGDGTVEGVQDEVSGLLAVLLDALEESGVQHISHHPYWTGVTTDAQKLAVYNYELINHDGSLGVHNTAFAVSVLQATYREFTGSDVPGVTAGNLLYGTASR